MGQAWAIFWGVFGSLLRGIWGFASGFESLGNVVALKGEQLEKDAAEDARIARDEAKLAREIRARKLAKAQAKAAKAAASEQQGEG